MAAVLAVLTSFASPVAGLCSSPSRPRRGCDRAAAGVAAGAGAGRGDVGGRARRQPRRWRSPSRSRAGSSRSSPPPSRTCRSSPRVALVLIPGDERVLRWGVVVYAAVAIALFVLDNAVGGNITRLGALFGGPRAGAGAGRPAPAGARDRGAAAALVAVVGGRPRRLRRRRRPLGGGVLPPAPCSRSSTAARSGRRPGSRSCPRETAGRPSTSRPPTRSPAAGCARPSPTTSSCSRTETSTAPRTTTGCWTTAVDYVAVPRGVDLDYLADDEAELIDAGPAVPRPRLARRRLEALRGRGRLDPGHRARRDRGLRATRGSRRSGRTRSRSRPMRPAATSCGSTTRATGG